MPGEFDRNRATDMERLLGQTMGADRSALTPPTPECLDAERLAAWSDGALSAIEGFDVEQHLSTCARCQAMLAAFVRITGAEPEAAVVLPFWRRRAVRWIAPVAAAAAAGVIWFVIPRSTSTPVATAEMARVEPMGGPIGDAPATTTSQATPPLPATSGAANREAKARNVAATGQLQGRRESAAPSSKSTAAPERQTRAGLATEPQAEVTVTGAVAPAAAPVEAPSEIKPEPPPARITSVMRGIPAGSPATPRVAMAAPSAPSAQVVRAEIVPATDVQTRIQNGTSRAAEAADANAARPYAAAPAPPEPRIRWRILADGRVERVVGEPGVATVVALHSPGTVTAGSAPTSSICWLVGPGGAVWRSTDGLRFDRVAFADAVDLTAVRATSAAAAAVTAADGRQFATANGGATWQILPGR